MLFLSNPTVFHIFVFTTISVQFLTTSEIPSIVGICGRIVKVTYSDNDKNIFLINWYVYIKKRSADSLISPKKLYFPIRIYLTVLVKSLVFIKIVDKK